MIKTIEFIGTLSGDGESACFSVDKETFIRLKGKEPGKYDADGDSFRLYPEDILGLEDKKYKFKIEMEEV